MRPKVLQVRVKRPNSAFENGRSQAALRALARAVELVGEFLRRRARRPESPQEMKLEASVIERIAYANYARVLKSVLKP